MVNYKKGFTLIELLVVVAIIGILSSVVLSNLNSIRAKSRDVFRAQSIHGMSKALEMYHLDNGSYPNTGTWHGNCSTFGSYGTTGPTGYIPNLAPTYIPELPLDPKPISTNGCFLYRSNGTDYFLMAFLTYEGTVPESRKRPAYPTQKSYAIYTPGAASW